MTEKKANQKEELEEKSKKVKKVTTGAWWKSALGLGGTAKKKKSKAEKDKPTVVDAPEKTAVEVKAPAVEPKPKAKPKAKPKPKPKPKARPKKSHVEKENLKQAKAKKDISSTVQENSEELDGASSDDSQGKEQSAKQKSPLKSKDTSRVNNKDSKQEEEKKSDGEIKGQVEEIDEEKPIVKLLINAEEPEECRIAQLENGRMESFHVETVVRERTKNNIYKGKIVSIEANLQAAFVDIGTSRNGFLPFSDIHPEYFRQDVDERSSKLISQHQWKKLKIENVVKKGQEVLVQVVKEVTGNKGANMTTYLSLPGRYLVLMPGSDSTGISRKIAGEERRAQLREMMSTCNIPEGIGYIVRTASIEITKTALQQDWSYLLRLWTEIKKRGQEKAVPAMVYEDQDTVIRFLRDYFVPEIKEILVDTKVSFDHVNKFVELLPTKQRKTINVKLHRGVRPIFNQHNVEEQIESIFQPQVQLPSGGSIVINPTEALVAIDVNSGRTSKDSNFEETIFLANMEAAAELCRQLRLRDLGGLIVVDFIDMRNKKHIREVERKVKNSMKRDKAKADMSRISRFGLMQISRQKMGAPIEKGSYRVCEHCQGRGAVRSVETLALYYLRRIQTGISRKKTSLVKCSLPIEVAQYLLNKKRSELTELETKHEAHVDIIPVPNMKPGENRIEFLSENGGHSN